MLANYTITNTGANFTITARPATWTTNPTSKTYGDADPSPLTTGSGTELPGGGRRDGDLQPRGRRDGAGGPYPITATLSPAGVLSNYTITNAGANFTITPKALTQPGDGKNKLFNASNPPLTGALTGVVAGDKVTASYSTYGVTKSLSRARIASRHPTPSALLVGQLHGHQHAWHAGDLLCAHGGLPG